MRPAASARGLDRLPDEQLCRRLAQGEAAAFDELYRRYSHRLAAYGSHLLGDAAAGEDVAQVALLKAYQALRGGTQPEKVRSWLYRIAHNAALDSLERRVVPVSEPQSIEAAALHADTSPAPEGTLVAALGALPERQRRVYLLREVHGLRVAEIAASLSLTAQQVEQTLFAARNGLAETLVFGERLDCETVRRLSSGQLEWREQRALQRHLRACPSCREAVPQRRRALVLLPFLPFDWLRRHVAQVVYWSPAAKAGAVAAAVVVAVAPPVAVHELGRGGRPGHEPALARTSVAEQGFAAVEAHRVVRRRPVATPSPAGDRAASPGRRSAGTSDAGAAPATSVAGTDTSTAGSDQTQPAAEPAASGGPVEPPQGAGTDLPEPVEPVEPDSG